MFVDITDTYAKTETGVTGNTEIKLYRLAGSEIRTSVILYNVVEPDDILEINFSLYGKYWMAHLFKSKQRIYKGSIIELDLDDGTVISLQTHSGAFKYNSYMRSLASISDNDILALTSKYVKQIVVKNYDRQTSLIYQFGEEYNGQYNTSYEGAELLRIACVRLVDVFNKTKVEEKPEPDVKAETFNANVETTTHYGDGRILTREYNLNTKYGRRMARRQAEYNYEHGSEKYRNDINEIRNVFWLIVTVICIVIFILIWNISGPEAAFKWLK